MHEAMLAEHAAEVIEQERDETIALAIPDEFSVSSGTLLAT